VGGVRLRVTVDYFGELVFESDEPEVDLREDKSKKISNRDLLNGYWFFVALKVT